MTVKKQNQSQFTKKQIESFNKLNKNLSYIKLTETSIAEKDQINLLLSIFKNSKNKRLLDIGCGTGAQSLRLAKYFKEVVGVDPSSESISVAKKSITKYRIKNVKVYVEEFNHTTFRSEFDYILMTNVLHHVENIDRLLKGTKKALKPKGAVVFFEQNPLNPLFIPFLYSLGMLGSHMNLPYLRSNMFTLKRILKRNGFTSPKIHRYAFLPSLLYSYSLLFKKFNESINRIPILNTFCAFHVIVCKLNK